ncbi:hypothetical protein ACKC9G_13605 [Pokkaliibacter sp. CJK22405]
MKSRFDLLTILFFAFIIGVCVTGYTQSDVQLASLWQYIFGAVS